MADRDALIVICWLVILILVFFECFHRKLKARFGGELRPPPSVRRSTSSVPSDGVALGGPSSLPNFRRGDLLPPTLGNNLTSMSRGARFTGPIAITTSTSTSDTGNNYCISSSKEVCRIPMTSMMMMSYENAEDEEPPPTYEEALSYGKFLSSLQSSPPYEDDQSVVIQCDTSIDNGVNINGDNDSANNNNANEISTTTAIFVNEEESTSSEDDDDDDDDGDDSELTSNQSANDTDNESRSSVLNEGEESKWDSNNNNDSDNNFTSATIDANSSVICKMLDNVAINNSHKEQTKQTQCNEKNLHVILSPSSSTSKSLDRFEIDYDLNTKKRILSSCSNAREKIKSSSTPPKLVSPSSHPENVL